VGIQIQLYTPQHASAVADMWNESRDNWGGASNLKTTEQVLNEEANSDSMFVFLAVDGERVVGYCSICEYREDTGALYVALLNVVPDYHGQKVGKMLVLESVQKTIDLGWPRLDLYTWTGNTKAVPLYKKCGFFWEDREDTTHLMNFIPTVLATEAIQDYFQEADWYQDCIREIVVKPDGRKENDYDYYEYVWKHNEHNLRVEFERRGRGLRLIETDDYLLTATVPNLDLVFGSSYPITYEIVNKTGKSLHVSFEGMDNQNIAFDYKEEVTVTDRTILTGTFFVGPIQEEQSVWRTHPCVMTNVLINGKKALFNTGINPKFPALIKPILPGSIQFTNKDAVLYLDMENNFAEDAVFSFKLPPSSMIHLGQYEYSLSFGSHERKSIPIAYHLLNHGFYEAELEITAELSDRQVVFHKKLGIPFTGIGAQLAGECDDCWIIANGKHTVKLSKLDNELIIGSPTLHEPTIIFYPKIGKPYSSEFSKKRAEKVEFFVDGGGIGLEATYLSNDYKSIELRVNTLLFADGTIRNWYDVHNRSEDMASSDLSLLHPIYLILHRSILPYKGQCMALDHSEGNDFNDWDANLVSENWLFARGNQSSPRGICWSNAHKLQFQGWHLTLESELGVIAPLQTVTTEPIYVSIGGFDDWQEFRAFAQQQSAPAELPRLMQPVELEVNERNPFIESSEDAVLTLSENKKQHFEGEIKASLHHDGLSVSEAHIYREDQRMNRVSYTLPMPHPASTDAPVMASIDAKFMTHNKQLNQVLFPVHKAPIQVEHITQSGKGVLTAGNGLIRIQASADFSPSIFSMKYKEHEWLHSEFPDLVAKSWWNSWMGGISGTCSQLTAPARLKESFSVEAASLTDSMQNVWQGLKTRQHFTEHKRYKGLTMEQYYLMLPGVPVLAYTAKIEQNTGTYFDNVTWFTNMFLKLAEDKTQGWFKTIAPSGQELTYFDQGKEIEAKENSAYAYGSNERQEMLQIVTDESSIQNTGYNNKDVVNLTTSQLLNMKSGDTLFTQPIFYVFTDQLLKPNALADLKAIRFGD